MFKKGFDYSLYDMEDRTISNVHTWRPEEVTVGLPLPLSTCSLEAEEGFLPEPEAHRLEVSKPS